VLQALASRFPATIELSIGGIIWALVVGIPFGIISALRNNKLPDHVSRLVALTGVSTPVFWLGLLLQLLFFYYFHVLGLPNLPSNGRLDTTLSVVHPVTQITGLMILDSLITGNFIVTEDALAHLILPSFALGFVSLGVIMRIMRSSMLEVLRQDYIILARSKGLSERVVIYRHALKNALIPTVTVTGLAMAALLGGAPLTETVFGWPGMGRLAVEAIGRNDAPLIMGFTLITALILVFVNLAVDLLYAYLDPRIKY
jgi:ABC-type dipeptide/oligopeptide/nickel transport system permease component